MKTVSTRVLLSCAAIGVAGGLLFVLTGSLHLLIIAAAPMFYGTLIAIYFVPGAIAQGLIRLPGVGLLTAVISGFLAAISPLQPLGFGAMGWIALIGVFQELAYLALLYRRWPLTPAIIVAVIAGLFFAVGFHFAFDLSDKYPSWLVIAQFVITPLAAVLATIGGWAIARALTAAGVYRRPRAVAPAASAPSADDAA